MKVLHIANDYWGTRLYSEMVLKLSEFDIYQFVFVPLRNSAHFNYFNIIKENIKIFYALIINSIIYRIFFHLKIRKSIHAIESNTKVESYRIIHAHTLFSDGAIACYFNKKYNVPYMIAIRNTDINVFLKYLIYLKPLGKKIIQNASKLIFLSPSYKNRLKSHYKSLSGEIENKAVIIHNGINEFWLNNINHFENNIINNQVNIIYAGEIRRNKNIINTIKAIELLTNQFTINFNIIGQGIRDEKKYLKEIEKYIKNKPFVKIYKSVPKEELITFYRDSHIFVMPSFTETFGLVYAEALSQGLPIIYTENEGFDKIFEQGFIGYSVNAHSYKDISNKIQNIISNYNLIQKNTLTVTSRFDWKNICQEYFEIYSSVVYH